MGNLINGKQLRPNTLKENLLLITGSTATNGQILAYDSSNGGFEWVNDLVVTGGTYSNGTALITFTDNVGDTFNVDMSSMDQNDTFVSGMTFNTGTYDLTIDRNDGTSFTESLGILAGDMVVTGGTYDINTGIVEFTNNSGGTFNVSGFTSGMTDSYTTTATTSGNIVSFNNNILGSNLYSVDLTDMLNNGGLWTAGTGTDAVVLANSGSIASGITAVAEGTNTVAGGDYSHAEGENTIASGDWSHAEGNGNIASGGASHAEGGIDDEGEGVVLYPTSATTWSAHAEGLSTLASGRGSHAEGKLTTASGSNSHAEGNTTTASGPNSHAEGQGATASGLNSHAEGNGATASGLNSHAEGGSTLASGDYSHAEGNTTTASGGESHAEGSQTTAGGRYSHAGGFASVTSGETSFIHSTNSLVTGDRSVVLGGQNITGATADTVYVPALNVRDIGGGTAVASLAIDTDGYVVSGNSIGSDTFTTGGTVSSGSLAMNLNDDTSFNVVGTIIQSVSGNSPITASTTNGAVTVGIDYSSIQLAVQTSDDKNLAPTGTTVGLSADTGVSLSNTPANGGYVKAEINGVGYFIANGEGERVASDLYLSDDGGATAKAVSAFAAGDVLYWNNNTTFDLDTDDRIDLFYEVLQ